MMGGPVELSALVDLALCDPDVGCVNFHHLRTLLHAMLKLNHHSRVLVPQKPSAEPPGDIQINVTEQGGDLKEVPSLIFDMEHIDSNSKLDGESLEVNRLIHNQSRLGERISALERSLAGDVEFPPNREILVKSRQAASRAGPSRLDTSRTDASKEDSTRPTSAKQDTSRSGSAKADAVAVTSRDNVMDDSVIPVMSQEDVTKLNSDEDQGGGGEVSSGIATDSGCNIAGPAASTTNLGLVWQCKKLTKRVESSEEGINKLFSLMDDILRELKDKPEQNVSRNDADELENMRNQLLSLQTQLEGAQKDLSTCRSDIDGNTENAKSNRNNIEQLVGELGDLKSALEKLQSQSNKRADTAEQPLVDHKDDDRYEKLVSMLTKKANMTDLESKADKSELESKADKSDLENKADKSELNGKADLSALDAKAGLEDVTSLQSIISQLQSEMKDIENKLSELGNKEVKDFTSDIVALHEKIDSQTAQTNETLLNHQTELERLSRELEEVRQGISNIDDNRLRDMIDNIEELKKLSNQKEKMDSNERKIQDLSEKAEQSKNIEDVLASRINDLLKMQEDLLASQNELKLTMPTFDASVMAAIQHLSQSNRNQIAALESNFKVLQQSQLSLQPNVVPVAEIPKSDNTSDEAEKTQQMNAFQNLQNHFLQLQSEQVKQDGRIRNMVDDYKEEFNRKQLHIDALYDYIDKLQANKTDKDDLTTEMNIKADKIALDNKVNMSTFDERYQLLEQSLQQALNRLDQYAEQETSLKDALHKLSTDLNSKMDTDAEKKLRRFLDGRLKEIQESRTELPRVELDARNAAGLRKPMPLSYNCLSCDRPIDITMRGVLPPVPHGMPSKHALVTVRPDKVNNSSSDYKTNNGVSYDGMAINRQCGGSHTSVNINMLRMVKVNPLQSEAEIVSSKSGINIPVADCVLGNDGQIYRGRFKLGHGVSDEEYAANAIRRHKQRKSRSAKSLDEKCSGRHSRHVVDERCYSASHAKAESKSSDESVSLPPISKDGVRVSTEG